MSFLLSTVCKSAARNVALARHAQHFARISAIGQPSIQADKYQKKLEASRFSTKLIKSFSTSAPPAASAHEDHSRLWVLEKGLSAALVAVVPLAFITPNPYLDYSMAVLIVTHCHWGLEAIVVDYVRPRLFGPVIPKIAIGLTYLLSILTLAGLYYFNYTDVGLSKAILMMLKK